MQVDHYHLEDLRSDGQKGRSGSPEGEAGECLLGRRCGTATLMYDGGFNMGFWLLRDREWAIAYLRTSI